MITCCYTDVGRQWSEQELADKLTQLPGSLRQAALQKKNWPGRQLTIAGKLLLKEVLKLTGSDLSLETLKFNDYHRPYFENGMDFNIAHSGNLVICAAADSGEIGIDIEQIKPISFADYTDCFTPDEWLIIRQYHDQYEGFYAFWTRKEAVLKAIGTGFHTPLSSVDVSKDHVKYDDIDYYLEKVVINQGYQCHIAATSQPAEIKLLPVSL